MTTTEFQRATERLIGLRLTLGQANEAMRTLTTAHRAAADVVAEFAKSARGAAMLKKVKGAERYERKMTRRGARSSDGAGSIPAWRTTPNPRIAHDLQRLREKRAADIERDLRAQAKRTRVMTSLPVEPPPLIPVTSPADFNREIDRVIPGAEKEP